jgi:large subunit ribosomal protein L4
MDLKLIDEKGESSATVAGSDAVFGHAYNEALVHQVVTAYLANGRAATRAQKDRGTVKHSTKKPWRQKGTGRARAGMTSSPLWRGGGRIFPNTPDENFSQKLNRKMYRAGLSAILSQIAREGRLAVVDGFTVDAPKTRLLAQKLKTMGLADDVLIITDAVDDNLRLSSRNLPKVSIVEV